MQILIGQREGGAGLKFCISHRLPGVVLLLGVDTLGVAQPWHSHQPQTQPRLSPPACPLDHISPNQVMHPLAIIFTKVWKWVYVCMCGSHKGDSLRSQLIPLSYPLQFQPKLCYWPIVLAACDCFISDLPCLCWCWWLVVIISLRARMMEWIFSTATSISSINACSLINHLNQK